MGGRCAFIHRLYCNSVPAGWVRTCTSGKVNSFTHAFHAITGDVISNQIPAFIDFEASSLDLIASYPIEAGLCLNGKHLHSWLIKTWLDWSESAEQIHGIERDELTQNGEDVATVARALNRLLPEQVFCDAFTFDSFWLHRLFRATP